MWHAGFVREQNGYRPSAGQMTTLTRRYLEALPPRKVYREVARLVTREEIDNGRDRLPAEMQYFSLASVLHEETFNGEMSQYFTNSSESDYRLAIEALAQVGAETQRNLVLRWLSRLPAHVHPESRNEVGTYVFSDPTIQSELGRIDKEYFSSMESFYEAMASYVKTHARAFGIS